MSWSGNENTQGSENSATIKVANESEIVCKVSTTGIMQGETIRVMGSLIPPFLDAPITLTFNKPDGSIFMRHLISDSDGRFNETYQIDESGNWAVSASWVGNAEYNEVTSSPISFIVKEEETSLTTYLTRPDVLGISLALISSIFGVVAWLLRARASKIRKHEFRQLLDELININKQFKNDSTRCEAELLKARNKHLDKLKLGRISKDEFDTLSETVDNILHEVKG